ncbi:MAG TPA: IS630 family transposase [Noviherbaspirillum sp.]|nr:IS630 family transposase [Noviherbaspirillum sp.]
MERSDSRLLSVPVLNERRRRAVWLRLSGITVDETAMLCELNRGTVIDVMKAYREGGWEAVSVQEHRGPDKGEGCLLDEQQQATIRTLVQEHTPDELELPFALWSRPAVTALVERETGVRLAVRTAGQYLKCWGYTPQKPLNKAYEQDPVAVQRWLDEEYPAIARRAQAEGGEIYWGDETGLRSDDVRGRSYAPQGQTPVVLPNHRREKVGVISAVTNKGVLRWMMLDRAINAKLMIDFLGRLVHDAGRKVFLILDNLKAHKAPEVKTWLTEHRERIEVFYLPSYSPELNPDELLNADLKHAIRKQAPKRAKGELKAAVMNQLRAIAQLPERIKQYFGAPHVAYAA